MKLLAQFGPEVSTLQWTYYTGTLQDYFVFPDVFRSEVCKGLNFKLVRDALVERGWLKLDPSGKPRNMRLSGNRQKRLYHIQSTILDGEG